MALTVSSSPHKRQKRTTGQVMRLVLFAALPGLLAQTWFFGWGAIVHFLLASAVAVVTEAAIQELRKKDVETAIKDCSAILTALLLAVSIPPYAPWWITVIGTFFAIAIVKQLYGGLGYNPFNPAMAAYVMLLISFPLQMTNWNPPLELMQYKLGLMDAVHMIFTGFSAEGYSMEQIRTSVDGFTMATPLDHVKTALTTGQTYTESLSANIFANGWGIGWMAVNMMYLLGGLYLLKNRIIGWQIPAGVLLGILLMAALFNTIDNDQYGSPLFHLLSGGVMLGAFFIATDPVSASTTRQGRLIFGFGIGVLIFVIRTWGGYPDAIAFAVLLMNMAVPLIDYYTQPRTYGHRTEHKQSIPAAAEQNKDKAP